MTKLVNRAKMTTATTGTGTITLGSAVDGYQTFADAGVANADVVRYVIEDGDAWEIGLGTYSAGTLTRGSIESSNADAALNLTGNAVVFVSAAAADLQELVDFADNFVLPTADGSTGQVLTTNGAGTLTFSTITGYSNADVDTHLNTGTASAGEVLSWTGSDYDWIAVSVPNISITDNSVALGPSADNWTNGVTIGLRAGTNANSSGGVAIGKEAGQYSGGAQSIGIGDSALRSSAFGSSGVGNIGIGYRTGYALSTGAYNFLGGYGTGTNITTGTNNVAIGNGALDAATTGGRNIAIGQEAMGNGVATSSTADNIAIGYQAGNSISAGIGNVAVGYKASMSDGSYKTAIGYEANSFSDATGSVAVGSFALRATSGEYNTAISYNSGYYLTTGLRNFFAGTSAAGSASTASYNVVIGNDAGATLSTGSNNTIIGNQANSSSATVSNEITLGNSSITTLRCQVTTITSLSDARDKKDIQPLNAGLEFVEALNPVSFTWDMRDGGKVGEADTGFIAQDLKQAQEDLGVHIPHLVFDANPDKLEAGYGKLVPVLVQAIKDLSAKVNELESRLEDK
jgi:hypothetical protein